MKSKIIRDWDSRVKNVDELHQDARLWLSEIAFIKDEIEFLRHLLASNYLDLISSQFKKEVEVLTKDLEGKKILGKELRKAISGHEKILSGLIATKSVESNTHFLEQHKELERAMLKYFKKYRKIKRTIFRITEQARKRKKQKKLT
ncbi:MAG: hypothetical protein QNJ57_05385 [Flavobacteriaceae bacterium]|nr:hypothetical protein [Flavobacteriaceae bacterium]